MLERGHVGIRYNQLLWVNTFSAIVSMTTLLSECLSSDRGIMHAAA